MKIGFIGAGNMASAIVGGMVHGSVLPPEQILLYDPMMEKTRRLEKELGVRAMEDCAQMVGQCDMLVLAVKPAVAGGVLAQFYAALSHRALISIAAGWTSDMLKGALEPSTRVLRVMPNTPALVGAGMTALSLAHSLSDEEAAFAEKLFGALGRVAWVQEHQMEAVIGLSGSGPAYVYMFIEAMADAGVASGLPRAQAYELAAQTVLGSAKMVLETGSHPGELKDAVCSPAGTTIAAVRSLEKDGFRSAVMEAVLASTEKALSMSRQ